MTILEQIKAKNIEALKAKDENARTILGMLVSKSKLLEITKREKGEALTEADLVQILQKTSKELSEEAANYAKANNAAMTNQILAQQKIVEGFLPQMMSQQEVEAIIATLPDKTLPAVMKHFKAEYAGKVDMKLVQEAAKKAMA